MFKRLKTVLSLALTTTILASPFTQAGGFGIDLSPPKIKPPKIHNPLKDVERARKEAQRRLEEERRRAEELASQKAQQIQRQAEAARARAAEIAQQQAEQMRHQAEVTRRRTEELARQKAAELQRQAEAARARSAEIAQQQAENVRRQAEEARRQAEAAHRRAEDIARQQAEKLKRPAEAAQQQAKEFARQQAAELQHQSEAARRRAEQAISQLDPSKMVSEELARERETALRSLRRLDPTAILNGVQVALSQQIQDQLQQQGINYDERTGMLDLRNTRIGMQMNNWVREFAQGNQGEGRVEHFTYNVNSQTLDLKLHVRHCQSWGKFIPGMGAVDLYSVTQSAKFRYDFQNNSADYDIDLGQLGPHINTRTMEALSKGDLSSAAQTLAPKAIGKLINYERVNEYDQRLASYQRRYGASNVYFASKDFVSWASPETIRKYAINGVVTAGASVGPQIMGDLKERAGEEAPALISWLQNHGVENAESIAFELLSGQTPNSPFLKFEVVPVTFSAREKPLNAMATPWRREDHLGFVIVWQNNTQSQEISSASYMRPLYP